MKKEYLKQLITKPTRRMRLLTALSLSAVAIFVFSYYVGVVSPNLAKAYSGAGSGDQTSPYRITNCTQLQEMKNNLSASYVLMNDIDCADTVNWNSGAGFIPIDNFSGNFDGRNYAIKDLFIKNTSIASVGLFGFIPRSSTVIENVSLTKSQANRDRIDITGDATVGSLVGEFGGHSIRNTHSDLNVRSTGNTTNLNGASLRLGGLVGLMRGNITHSSSTGSVGLLVDSANNSANRDPVIGGLVGYIDDWQLDNYHVELTDSYSTAKVLVPLGTIDIAGVCGGLVGQSYFSRVDNTLKILRNYSTGEVTCLSPNNAIRVGSFIGSISVGGQATHNPVIQNNFTVSKVAANRADEQFGFYATYFSPQSVVSAEGNIDLQTNTFDSYLTGSTHCGNDINVTCPSVDTSSQSNYFTQDNQDGFFSSWSDSNWAQGSSYPTLTDWSVRTNAPTNLDVTRDGNDFILNWTKPSGDGARTSNIVNYAVSYATLQSNGSWSGFGDGSVLDANSSTYTFTGLTIPGKYRFRVIPVYQTMYDTNTQRIGLPSDEYEFATGMPSMAPTNIVSQPKSKTAAITWDEVEGATNYVLQFRKTGEINWITFGGTTANLSNRSATLGNLDPTVSYELRLQANNIAGMSPWSDTQTFTTISQHNYDISDCQQLQGINNDLEGIYTLQQDIDCTNIDFQPIADQSVFMGTLNGNFKKIINLSILTERSISQPTLDYSGIGFISNTFDATIQNLTLQNPSVIVNYTLSPDVDSDQNGLVDGLTITTPEELGDATASIDPGALSNTESAQQEIRQRATSVGAAASDILRQITEQSGTFGQTYANSAKLAVGGVVGISLGQNNFNNIQTTNGMVRGGISGGVIGLVLPASISSAISGPDSLTPGDPVVMKDLHSGGLVIGNLAGGVIGVVAGTINPLFGQTATLTVQDSTSSSEVQANIGGGLIGAALGTTGLGIMPAIGQSNSSSDGIEAQLGVAFQRTMNTQDVIIANSSASGLVSACQAPSNIRLAALGGLVGVGLNVHISGSHSSGDVSNCTLTNSNWGVYGGAMGGLSGVLVFSRVSDSSSTGNVVATNNDPISQSSAVNTFMGMTGGISGVFLYGGDDVTLGKNAIENTYSTGSTRLDSKYGFLGVSGGITGLYIGSGTIRSSHSSGNITHHLIDKSVGAFSFAGGINGMTIGADLPYFSQIPFYGNSGAPGGVTRGLLITDTYSTSNIAVQKDNSGGSLSVGGGLLGLFIGQGTISNSYASGNVTGGLPDYITAEDQAFNGVQPFLEHLSDGSTQYGAAVSGGLVGAAYGIDFHRLVSTIFYGFTGGSTPILQSQGLVVDSTHASGNVKGNLAGGLFGSADLNVKINKSYSEGNTDGAIVGGIVGQGGFLDGLAPFGGAVALGLAASSNNQEVYQTAEAIASIVNIGLPAIGPVEISNTYSTGDVTGVPGLAKIDFFGALGKDTSNIVVEPIRLPTTVGGIAGLFMSSGGSITDSYSAGNITVDADQDTAVSNSQNKDIVKFGKIPNFAGGIIGFDVALPLFNYNRTAASSQGSNLNGGPPPSIADSADKPQVVRNVFSSSKISLNSSSITGGSFGIMVSPVEFVTKFMINGTTTTAERNKLYQFNNVYLDKSRVSATNCNGPKQQLIDVVNPFLGGTIVPKENGQLVNLKDDLDNGDAKEEVQGVLSQINDILSIQTACQYVNSDGSNPRYFIQNKTNAPMNQWNFISVWNVRKDDYPKFVAGVSTDDPNGDPGTGTDGGTGTGTGTNTKTKPIATADLPKVTNRAEQQIREVARKAGFVRTPEKVKGLKAILASVPVFIAKSIPYSLVLVLLALAMMYSYQALREYRQLSVYHAAITRIVTTKESIDSYLAITTHYLNTPVAIMGGAVELLESLKKISANKASSLKSKIKRFNDAASTLLTANQVSNAQSSNDEKLVKHEQPSPIKAKSVWIPAAIALVLLLLANALFMYADVFNRSPYRLLVEFSLYALGVFLVALAYRYRNFMAATKDIAKKQLAMESQLYQRRQSFIPQAIKVVSEHYDELEITSESLKKVPEAKLFMNGLHMLGGIKEGLNNIRKFANFEAEAPLFDVSTYIQKSVHSLGEKAADKKVSFDANIAPGLVGYIQPEAARQIVDSLLDNALKFSKEGGHIQVNAYRRLNKLVFSVSDDGVGISENKLPSLLKPFSRGTDSMEYNYEGLGLGLYTNKIITNRLGGTLAIQSELGKGTIVTVTIPFQHEAKALAPVLITPEATA